MSKKLVIIGFENVIFDPVRGLWEEARKALARLFVDQIPVVLWSSLNRVETIYYSGQLGLREPFVVENGAALFFPLGYFDFDISAHQEGAYQFVQFGAPASDLIADVQQQLEKKSLPVRFIGEFSAEELAQLYKIPLHLANLKQQNEFSAIFTTAPYYNESWEAELVKIANQKNCRLHFDGVSYVLQRKIDSKNLFEALRHPFERYFGYAPVVVSVGGTEADEDFLKLSDQPIWLENNWPASTASKGAKNYFRPKKKGPAAWEEILSQIQQSL